MKLFKHQQQIVEAFPDKHVLVWETGTGKSLAALKLAEKTRMATLVICPKALKLNWQRMVKGQALYALVLTKEEFKKSWRELDMYSTVVVDEAHYFFGTRSAMMKSLKAYFKKWNTPYRYFLTATPFRSTPMDIFVMADLLGKPMSYPAFFRKFFYEIRMGRRVIPQIRPDIEEDVAEIVKRLGSVVRLDECADVPEQVFETEYFQLTTEQIVGIENLTDIMPIVRFTKEHQICGGTLLGDEYNDEQTFTSDKFDRLMELVSENDRMIIVCRYNQEIKHIHNHLPHAFVINGGISGDDRQATIDFLKDQKKYVLLVNSACSEGWELPECPLMIFYSYDFALKNYIQMLGRIQRINNIKKNTYLSLIVKGTIDEDVYECIQRKEEFNIAIYAKER